MKAYIVRTHPKVMETETRRRRRLSSRRGRNKKPRQQQKHTMVLPAIPNGGAGGKKQVWLVLFAIPSFFPLPPPSTEASSSKWRHTIFRPSVPRVTRLQSRRPHLGGGKGNPWPRLWLAQVLRGGHLTFVISPLGVQQGGTKKAYREPIGQAVCLNMPKRNGGLKVPVTGWLSFMTSKSK